MKTIKAAVIGVGFIGPVHVEALRRLGFVEVAALADIDKEKAEQKAASLGVPQAYDDYRRVLDDPEIEVVHNCSPNHLHAEINRAILEAGKHCVSEKPLGRTTEETRALAALAKQKPDLAAAVSFCYRYYPLCQQAKAMREAGELGEVYAIHGRYLQDWLFLDTDYSWRLDPEVSGASCAVADIGSHFCDLVQYISGLTITEVMADLVTTHKVRKRPKASVEAFAGKLLKPEDYEEVPIATEDYANVLFGLDNGARGLFNVSQVSAGRKNHHCFEIDGSKCAIAWNQEEPNELWVGHREKANEMVARDPSLLKEAARRYAHYPGGHPEGYPDGFKNLMLNVYRKVSGEEPNADFPTFEDGHRAAAVVEAILASHQSRQWTEVAY